MAKEYLQWHQCICVAEFGCLPPLTLALRLSDPSACVRFYLRLPCTWCAKDCNGIVSVVFYSLYTSVIFTISFRLFGNSIFFLLSNSIPLFALRVLFSQSGLFVCFCSRMNMLGVIFHYSHFRAGCVCVCVFVVLFSKIIRIICNFTWHRNLQFVFVYNRKFC